MNQEDKDRIVNKLKEKGALNDCPRCNHNRFSIVDYSYLQPIEDPKKIVIGGSTIPVVIVGCNNCGFIVQHALGILGLMDNKDSTND